MSTRTVVIVAFPDVQVLDVTGPMQVLASANEFASHKGASAPYRLSLVAQSPRVRASCGLEFSANALPLADGSVDTLVVPGGRGVDAAAQDAHLVAWIRNMAATTRRTVSICTGSFLLAQAGLLDGRAAASHWARCQELSQRFPEVNVKPEPIFVRDGRIWSSAGVTAGMDLCLALVEDDIGRSIALDVARDLVMFLKRPGNQSQYSRTLSLQHAQRFDDLHDWVQENLSFDLPIQVLASRCAMTERTFSRRYKREVGCTPARMIERLRIEAAQRMLAESDDPVKQVADACGFESEEVLRRSFQRLLSMSPREYRRAWRRTAGEASDFSSRS